MVRAIVDSVIRLPEEELPPRTLAILDRALSFPNPEFLMRQRMGRWTGATPEEIGLIDRDDQGRLVFPRGTVGVLRAALASAGMKLTFDDRRVRHDAPLAIGAKSTSFAKSATQPSTAASELKAKTKLPPPGGAPTPAVTPRSTVATSSPSLR